MPDRIPGIQEQINRLEDKLDRLSPDIDIAIRNAIADLRLVLETQRAELIKQIDRLADDQRRYVDRLMVLEKAHMLREGKDEGKSNMWSGITHFLTALVGGLIAWAATHWNGKPPPFTP